MQNMSDDFTFPILWFTVEKLSFAFQVKCTEYKWIFISANRCGQWVSCGYLIANIGPQNDLMNETIHVK